MNIFTAQNKRLTTLAIALGCLFAPSLAQANEQSFAPTQTPTSSYTQTADNNVSQLRGTYNKVYANQAQPTRTRRVVEPIPVARSYGFSQASNGVNAAILSIDPVEYKMPVLAPKKKNVRKSMPVLLDTAAYYAR